MHVDTLRPPDRGFSAVMIPDVVNGRSLQLNLDKACRIGDIVNGYFNKYCQLFIPRYAEMKEYSDDQRIRMSIRLAFVRGCFACGKTSEIESRFFWCESARSCGIRYCSEECQRRDWKIHRVVYDHHKQSSTCCDIVY
jgi:hypothetical protein